MEKKTATKQLQNIFKIGIFLGFAVIIIQLFPSEAFFNHHYEEGEAWQGETLTAPFGFSIGKAPKQIEAERIELLRSFVPYYKIDTIVGKSQINNFLVDFNRKKAAKPYYKLYISEKLEELYTEGIISVREYNDLIANNTLRINCVYPDHSSRTLSLKELHTPKTAYLDIVQVDVDSIDRNILDSFRLNFFIVPNLVLDTVRTAVAERELLKTLSLTMGFVQTGDRIVEKGEIISPEVFAILNSLKKETEVRGVRVDKTKLLMLWSAKAILVLVFVTLLFLYFYFFRPSMYEHYSNLLIVLLLILLLVSLTALALHFQSKMIHYYMIPYAILPIILRVFFDSRTAFYSHLISSLIISFMIDAPFLFLVLQIVSGTLAVFSMKDMVQRSQLAHSAICVFLSYSVIYLCFNLIEEKEFGDIDPSPFIFFAINSLFILFSYILIYLLEKIFGFISSVTLVELTNVDSSFMMKFAEVAPGSFQHSLQVSNLAMEAAKKINANSLLVRTGALYHDIGKMSNPAYFTENQASGGENPLLEMDFEDAARIIIDHVPEGIKIAKKRHLPEQIIHFIATHHGTTKVKYFYNSFINANPDIEPNDAAFTYPGPLPDSKETAILMMADAVEARSRSLKEYTVESISDMVEDMINLQITDGQLKNAPISFRDVERVKEVFKQKLANIYHTRITYPKANKEKEVSEEADAN